MYFTRKSAQRVRLYSTTTHASIATRTSGMHTRLRGTYNVLHFSYTYTRISERYARAWL